MPHVPIDRCIDDLPRTMRYLSAAYFEAARVLAPAPLLCYAVLLFQLSLMDVKVCKGQLGALVAYTGGQNFPLVPLLTKTKSCEYSTSVTQAYEAML